jgi:hypothetical protein
MQAKIVPLTVKHITFTITAKDEKERLLLRMLKAAGVNTLQLMYFPLGEYPDKISFKIPNKIKNQWNKECEKIKEAPDGQE